MSNIRIHEGWLTLKEDYNDHETVGLNGEPIAEELDYLSGKVVTVKYYIANKEGSEEELKEDFLINTLYGNLESDYGACYSEMTGYLWTNDNLKIGGHDLRQELESYAGKYLYLIIEIDEEAERKKQEQHKLQGYKSALYHLADKSRSLNKSFEDVVEDFRTIYK